MQLFLVLELSVIILQYSVGATSKLDYCHVMLSLQICTALQCNLELPPPPPPTPATKKIEQLSLHGLNLLADSETQPSYLSPHSEGVIFNLQNTREQSVIIFSDEIIKTIMNKTERYSLPILMFSASKLISAYG